MNSIQQQVSSTKPKVRSYKDLIAWQKTDSLACAVYEVTATFPKSEMFGLTSQLRRAAVSVPTNIVEGFSRLNKNEFRHFLSISLGSLAEVQYLLEFSYKQKFINQVDYDITLSLKEESSRLLWKLHESQKIKTNT